MLSACFSHASKISAQNHRGGWFDDPASLQAEIFSSIDFMIHENSETRALKQYYNFPIGT